AAVLSHDLETSLKRRSAQTVVWCAGPGPLVGQGAVGAVDSSDARCGGTISSPSADSGSGAASVGPIRRHMAGSANRPTRVKVAGPARLAHGAGKSGSSPAAPLEAANGASAAPVTIATVSTWPAALDAAAANRVARSAARSSWPDALARTRTPARIRAMVTMA